MKGWCMMSETDVGDVAQLDVRVVVGEVDVE